MMKEVFSKKRFIDTCQKRGMHFMEMYEALKYWASDCEGKTKEELESVRGFHYDKDHFDLIHWDDK